MLLLLLVVPVPWIAKAIWPHEIKYAEIAIITVISVIITVGVYAAGHYGQTADVEVWNGEVLSKDRKHDSYVRTYSCRCRNVCSGSGKTQSCSQQCDTCYEDRYTVKWTARTNLRDYTIQSFDSSSRSVYLSPDPGRYTVINPGDPVAMTQSYTNYVKAVPESLFHAKLGLIKQYQNKIPTYPSQIYDFYKVDRVLPVGVPMTDVAAWNQELSLTLRKLGPQRQANVAIVVVNEANSTYVHALEAAWLGGKKNDVIVVVGSTQYPKIDWVRIISWTKNETFKVQLRDELAAHGTVDRTAFMSIINKAVGTQFVRRSMKDFEYLAEEIEPPLWVIVLAGVLGLLSALGTSYFFYRNDLN
jgi:hypothetical protein